MHHFVCLGFRTVSGKPIEINKSAYENARKKFDLTDENANNIKPPEEALSMGFKTATGKTISIREESLKLAKAKILDKDGDSHDASPYPCVFKSDDQSSGFKTVSGKPIEINKEAYEAARKKFEPTKEDSIDPMNGNVGFKTAMGKTISVRDESLQLAKEKILNNVDDEKESTFSGGFKTVSGKPIAINKEALEIARTKFEPIDANMEDAVPFKMPMKEQAVREPMLPKLVVSAPLPPPPSMNNRRMLDGKRFKKPQLVHKAKLSKYIESSSEDTDKNEDTGASIQNLFNNSVNTSMAQEMSDTLNQSSAVSSSPSTLIFSSQRLNAYIKANESLFNPHKVNEVQFLSANKLVLQEVPKKLPLETRSGHKFYMVKPVLEVKSMQVE